jgi:AcrR family transcriptional regulator
MTTATSSDAMQQRQAIVQTAVGLFVKQGLPITSMEDIVAQSGLPSDVVYGHFPRKNDLLRVLGDLNKIAATGALRQLLAQPTLPTVDELVGKLGVFFEESVRTGDPVGVTPQGWGVALYDDEVKEIMGGVVVELRETWIEVVARLIAEGRLPAEADPQDVGRAFFSLFLGFMVQNLLGDVTSDHLQRALKAILR